MSNYIKSTKQNVENIDDDDFFAGMSNETRKIFMRALFDAEDAEIRKIEEETKDMEIPPPSKRHKTRMNRLFRERVGGSFLPFPEEDNLYERVRSRLVIKLNVNELFDRRKNRRRKIKG